jgi:casein kinase II subunit alpha
MIKIAKVLGTPDVLDYVDKFNLKMHPNIEHKMQNFRKKPWEKFVSTQNSHLITDEIRDSLFDLLT